MQEERQKTQIECKRPRAQRSDMHTMERQSSTSNGDGSSVQATAVEAVESLEAALRGWRLQDLYRGIDEELAVLKNRHSVLNATLPCASTCVVDNNWFDQYEEVEGALKQIKATKERRAQLTIFINKIKSNERKEQRTKSKRILLCNHATST